MELGDLRGEGARQDNRMTFKKNKMYQGSSEDPYGAIITLVENVLNNLL